MKLPKAFSTPYAPQWEGKVNFARKRQSLFGQKCELVFVRERTKAQSDGGVPPKKDRHPKGCHPDGSLVLLAN